MLGTRQLVKNTITRGMWRARRELNPGPPGFPRAGKSFTECDSPVLYLTELRALPLMESHEYEKGFAILVLVSPRFLLIMLHA